MNQLKAFVGHSFLEEDKQVVSQFLDFFDNIKKLDIKFSWEHAEPAEPKTLAKKVLDLTENCNLFIGICTRREYVLGPNQLKPALFSKKYLRTNRSDPVWKTSDWIIQEIGLCIGKRMDIILLLEDGIRKPGGLQDDLEYIPFQRDSPQKAFNKILEMIKALIPKSVSRALPAEPSPAGEHEKKADQKEPINMFEPEEWWTKEDFSARLWFAILKSDSVAEDKMFQAYLATSEGQKDNKDSWEAERELFKIELHKGGLISNLERMAQMQPNNSEIHFCLGRAFESYEEFGKAAEFFTRSAQKSTAEKQLSRLADAAVAFSKAGQKEKARGIINEIVALKNELEGGETIILKALKTIAGYEKDDDQYFGATEALLDSSPDNHEMRFELAYRYSDVDSHDLALYHYNKIPIGNRSEITWNNIGVANANLNLDSMAVKAYRKSQEQGGTLAMSNIAYKFITAGFLTEAEDLCTNATKIENFDKAIGRAISKIKEVQDSEQKEQDKILGDAKTQREFYRDFGLASGKLPPTIESSTWEGPQGKLVLEIRENKLEAEGNYEVSNALAAISTFASLVQPSKPNRYTIRYEGTLIGFSAKGKKIKVGTDAKPKALGTFLTGLSSESEPEECLMIISDTLKEIRVYEKGATPRKRFYLIKKSE